MPTQTYPAGETPRLIITGCEGTLQIETSDQPGFTVEPALAQAVSREDRALVVHAARGDMRLRVPAATELAIENHAGDLRIESIDGTVWLRDIAGDVFVSGAGALRIERDQLLRDRVWSPHRPRRDVEARNIGAAEIAEVHGSLVLADVRGATVGEIGGNARASGVAEDLRLGDVGGNCEISQVGGALEVANIGGNCRIEQISGSLRAGHIGGSAEIRAAGPLLKLGNVGGNLTLTDAPLGQEAAAALSGSIAVGGSARIELPKQADLTINAIVGGGVSGPGVRTGPGIRTIVYGGGAAHLRLTVGGHLTLA
ncbi:MAG TPA: hypothetical protein VFU22_07835 [Roseiflexaceae bacterium]|nr:hypothetical protein [Roseiflexaceae bacterium]